MRGLQLNDTILGLLHRAGEYKVLQVLWFSEFSVTILRGLPLVVLGGDAFEMEMKSVFDGPWPAISSGAHARPLQAPVVGRQVDDAHSRSRIESGFLRRTS